MSEQASASGLNRPIALGAIMAIGVLGVSGFLLLPSIISGLVSDLQYGQQQIGKVSTWQLIGLGLGSIALVPLLKLINWRAAAGICLAMLIAGEVASALLASTEYLVAMRFLAGFGGGLCVGLAAYLLAQTESADRNFGFFLAAQVVFAILLNTLLPMLLAAAGLPALFYCIAALAAVALIIGPRLVPANRWEPAPAGAGNDGNRWLRVSIVLLGILLFFTMIGAFWTYITPIGLAAGLTQQQTGAAISIGLVGALLGSNAPAIFGDRVGRLPAMALGVVLQLLAIGLFYTASSNTGFVVAAVLFCLGWYAYVPYQFGLLAEIDQDGRPAMLLNGVAGIGSGIGPAVVAGVIATGFEQLFVVGVILLVASFVCHLLVLWLGRAAVPNAQEAT